MKFILTNNKRIFIGSTFPSLKNNITIFSPLHQHLLSSSSISYFFTNISIPKTTTGTSSCSSCTSTRQQTIIQSQGTIVPLRKRQQQHCSTPTPTLLPQNRSLFDFVRTLRTKFKPDHFKKSDTTTPSNNLKRNNNNHHSDNPKTIRFETNVDAIKEHLDLEFKLKMERLMQRKKEECRVYTDDFDIKVYRNSNTASTTSKSSSSSPSYSVENRGDNGKKD